MVHIKRAPQQIINQLLNKFPAVAIIGARQAGKTTLAKQLRPQWRYLDLENPNDFELISRDPVFYFSQFDSEIIIDEAQCYPQLFNVLRGVIDKQRSKKGRFIITGSSSPELTNHISESLAGRIATVEVGTLKANEYYQQPLSDFYNVFKDKLDARHVVMGRPPLSRDQINQVWLQGGYPEPVLSQDENFCQQWMENYYFNYVNRDVARLFPKMNKIKYQHFIKMLSQLSSTIVNKSQLGRALEISEGSAREYLKIADGTFLWRELYSFESKVIKSVVKMPKGYLRDSGLLHYLLNIRTLDELYQHPIVGQSFEGFVIEEIIKGLNAIGITHWQANYFRTRRGAEVDLVLQGHFGILPVEIKYSSTVTIKNLRALNDFVTQHNVPFGIVINQAEEAIWLTDRIVQVPVGWL